MHKSRTSKKTLFIFRRDLRLQDNTGLIFALQQAEEVVPCFIFTPEQTQNNPYKGDHCLQFMIESLEDLEKDLQAKGGNLYLFQGKPDKVVEQLIKELAIDSVVVNRDYTPYSVRRDQEIHAVCQRLEVSFYSFDDALLHPPEQTLKSDGKPYTVFTPFYRNACKLIVDTPKSNRYDNYYSKPIPFSLTHHIYQKILSKRVLPHSGGRTLALKILKTIERFSAYESLRDFPAEDKTTHLSAHLKFTTCSSREVYYALSTQWGPSCSLIRSLYWRDFFTSLSFHFPYVFSGPFQTKWKHLEWSQDKKIFQKWCKGETGFPIVDAGMRELNETGFMHNRVRMVAASFLVKDLHIDWRWGEKYFAETLIDYDPAVNNGNWQWIASTGCDAQPYFRVFNPWTQAIRFDPDCLYIKKWIPDLIPLPASIIHKWNVEKYHEQCPSYPAPIVDHSHESKISIALYKKQS